MTHVLIFADQPEGSMGGAQVSIRLQRRFLELAGHRVTVVAPRWFAPAGRSAPSADADLIGRIDMPAVPITVDREYSMMLPTRAAVRHVARELQQLPPVDLVHVQADFWGGLLGVRFAERFGLPLVVTLHNRLDVGLEAVTPAPLVRPVVRVLGAWQRMALGRAEGGTDPWGYLRTMVSRADAVVAPTKHFARVLAEHGIADRVHVLGTGVDDAVVDAAAADDAAAGGAVDAPRRPRLVWVGRFSPEKRLMEFLEAVARARVDADVTIVGAGLQDAAARRFVASHGLEHVRFAGSMPYAENVAGIAASDALVQTSIGFETQGMTVQEALSLGTPVIVSDPAIAGELPAGTHWRVDDDSVDALARAIEVACGDISAGTAPAVDPALRRSFLQSTLTAQMIELYDSVLAAR